MKFRSTIYTSAILLPAAVVLAVAAPARADSQSYLDALSQHGIEVTSQSEPGLRMAGLQMCTAMHNGTREPADVAARWLYPNATEQNLLDMALAARSELCPYVG